MHSVMKIRGYVDGKKIDLEVQLNDKGYTSFFKAIMATLKKVL